MTAAGSRRTPILLAHSYYLRYDQKQIRKMKPYPPLATLCTASVLRASGFDVRLFDAMLAEGVEEFRHGHVRITVPCFHQFAHGVFGLPHDHCVRSGSQVEVGVERYRTAA